MTYTKLYESLVTPILDYGLSVWGFKVYDSLDKVQNRATRYFMGVHRFAPKLGHNGDMGWTSNRGRWKISMLRLWNRLVGMDNEHLLKRVFIWDREEHLHTNKANFSSYVKPILTEVKKKNCYTNMQAVDIDEIKRVMYDIDKADWDQR